MLARCCGRSPLKSCRFSLSGLAEAICEMRSQSARLRCPVWSGRIEARIGLRMMPTFPRSLYHSVRRVFPSTAGRLAFQTVPSRIVSSLSLLPACAVRRPVCIVLRALRHRSGDPALCQAADSIVHRLGGLLILRPRGPRSGPGYSVPVRHHLIDPIRPTRGHTAISPHGGLYAMPSLCGSA